MTSYKFDDRNIFWQTLEGFEGVAFFILNVDEQSRVVDIVYKFSPGVRQPLHRHRCPYFTFVLQGELRFYRPDGSLKEVRPTGSYVTGIMNGEPHLEGAGEEEAVVFFGHRDIENALYEFVDDGQVLGVEDFKALLARQVASMA